MAEMPAEHVGGVTAFAVTVTGVATELAFAGEVIVMMPFEVEPKAQETTIGVNAPIKNLTQHF